MLCGLLVSATSAAKDVVYQASYKVWHNTLATDYRDFSGQTQGKYETANSSVIALSARKNQWFLAGSALLNSDYVLKPEVQTGTIELPFTGVSSRRDFDVGLGWSLLPKVSLLVGYKQVGGTRNYWFKRAFPNQPVGANLPEGDYSVHNDLRVKAPFVGVSGAQSMYGSFFVYGSAIVGLGAKLDLNLRESFQNVGKYVPTSADVTLYEVKKQHISGSADYYNFEVGVGHRASKNVQLTIGYRDQKMTLDNRPELRIHEDGTLKGVNLGASYTF
jgi:hypothetical protein